MIMININGESIADVQKMMDYVRESLDTRAAKNLCPDNGAPLGITVSQFPPMPFYPTGGFGCGPIENGET